MTELEDIEAKLGYELPKEFVEFLNTSDKEEYENKEYCRTLLDGYITDGKIERFSTYETFFSDNEYRSFLEEFQAHFEIQDDYVESKYLYLIALCDSDSICMALNGKHRGKIYSVDNGDFGITFQANTLEEFLKSLYSSSDYKCSFKELQNAVLENNLTQLKELIEEKDGNLILKQSSFCDIDLFDKAYNNNLTEILEYLISKGFNGFNRAGEYGLI